MRHKKNLIEVDKKSLKILKCQQDTTYTIFVNFPKVLFLQIKTHLCTMTSKNI